MRVSSKKNTTKSHFTKCTLELKRNKILNLSHEEDGETVTDGESERERVTNGQGGVDLLIARIMGQSGPTVLEALGAQRPTFRGTGLEMTVEESSTGRQLEKHEPGKRFQGQEWGAEPDSSDSCLVPQVSGVLLNTQGSFCSLHQHQLR